MLFDVNIWCLILHNIMMIFRTAAILNSKMAHPYKLNENIKRFSDPKNIYFDTKIIILSHLQCD